MPPQDLDRIEFPRMARGAKLRSASSPARLVKLITFPDVERSSSHTAKFRARVPVAKYADQRADILADRLQWLTCGEPEEARLKRFASHL
ncbi:hypothetical protein LA080_010018 [Diaporthe eres]|nr:hypothetical protein LA080_010018 [Diaporthe eres]